MSGTRFPWLPVLVLAAAMAWAASGSGAARSRDASRGEWDAPTLLAQVTPPGGTDEGGEGGEDQEFDPSDTLDVEEGDPLTPDTTLTAPPPFGPSPAPADSTQEAPPTDTTLAVPPRSPSPADTVLSAPAEADTAGVTAPPDTLHGTFLPVTVDSATAAARRAAAADSGVGDTLFTAKPKPQGAAAPAAQPPKPRTGILGVHPIVILLGLAALHYFVVKATGD